MPQVRLVLSIGLPDPDRLSTMLVWSLMGHLGIAIGILIYQQLPSHSSSPTDGFFVSLAAPASSGGPTAEASPPKPAPPKQAPPPKKAPDVPVPVPVKTLPPESEKKPTPHQKRPPEPAPEESPSTEEGGEDEEGDDGAGEDGTGPGAASAGGAEGTGVGGSSFGEGFHYGWYQAAVEAKLQSRWRKPLASSAIVETSTVSFRIKRDGSVSDVAITAPSGSSALDLSVIRAVYDANPLPALPRGWSGDSVHVSMEFRLTPGAP